MRVTEVEVEYSRTVNLGNYHSVRGRTVLRGEVQEDETYEDVAAHLHEQAVQLTQQALAEAEPSVEFVEVNRSYRGIEVEE